MSHKLTSLRTFGWVSVIVAIVFLLLLFFPGIRELTTRMRPQIGSADRLANTMPGLQPKQMPGAGSESLGNGTEEHPIIFHVVDAKTSARIAGASLKISLFEGEAEETGTESKFETDEYGDCAMSLPAQTKWVGVRARSYVPHVLRFQSEEAFSAEYTFRLEKGMAIGGLVRNPDGKPIPDAKITVQAEALLALGHKAPYRESINPKSVVLTNADGHWDCEEVPPDPSRINLDLSHSEYASGGYTTGSASDPLVQKHIELQELASGKAVLIMQYGLVLAGSVADEDGKAIEGADVIHYESLRPQSALSGVSTSSDGRFVFTDTRPGEATVEVHAKGFVPESRTVKVARGCRRLSFG